MYTTARVTTRGILLRRLHRERLGGDRRADEVLDRLANAGPGVYAARLDDAGVRIDRRNGSSLYDGMPTRFAVSPFATRMGRFAKLAPPNPYEGVRISGVATLLTSEDGRIIYEACLAAVLSFDGQRIVCPPDEHPRTLSLAESAVRSAFAVKESPIERDSARPLILVNAVKGVCAVELPGREPMPPPTVLELERMFEESVG